MAVVVPCRPVAALEPGGPGHHHRRRVLRDGRGRPDHLHLSTGLPRRRARSGWRHRGPRPLGAGARHPLPGSRSGLADGDLFLAYLLAGLVMLATAAIAAARHAYSPARIAGSSVRTSTWPSRP